MQLELTHGYPMPKEDVVVAYDGAVWFFYQGSDDEKIVLAADSVGGAFRRWLIQASVSTQEKPLEPETFDIPGGKYRGIRNQPEARAIWVLEAQGTQPTVYLEQGGSQVAFDADEAVFLASILEADTRPARPRRETSEAVKVAPCVRPQDVTVSCPRCKAEHGKLMNYPYGQNEVRCDCGFSFSFRYTPDMTEGN